MVLELNQGVQLAACLVQVDSSTLSRRLMPLLGCRGPITDAAGTAERAEAAAFNDHCGTTPLLGKSLYIYAT